RKDTPFESAEHQVAPNPRSAARRPGKSGNPSRWHGQCVWYPRISVCTTFAGMATYDLIVIGSGPAGEKGAAQAAYFGKRTALIEKAAPHLGGACTNTGTLPSKTLRESALALTGMASRRLE